MPNWNQILEEINQETLLAVNNARTVLDRIRKKHLDLLHKATGRNIIVYYSGWLSKAVDPNLLSINDEDKNGFMMAIHNLDTSKGLDLILHTPGGDIEATVSIVDYLQKKFGSNIRAIVPQMAMSAGTMIACSCKEILMARHSNLGPIDPQVYNMPAYEVISTFERAHKEMKADPTKVNVWHPILMQYNPTLLNLCDYAIRRSKQLVEKQLTEIMFKNDAKASEKASKVVTTLSDTEFNKTHGRHIHYEECKDMGLNVQLIEELENKDLQDLILTVHHCYMHTLMNTPACKIIENQIGAALVKNAKIEIVQQLPMSI